MSHPVFLSSSALPRMPEGSRNEWRGFFGHGGELEAKEATYPYLVTDKRTGWPLFARP